jgi:hypothetical protein
MKEWLLVMFALMSDGSTISKTAVTQAPGACKAAGMAFIAAPIAPAAEGPHMVFRTFMCAEFLPSQEARAGALRRGLELKGAWTRERN